MISRIISFEAEAGKSIYIYGNIFKNKKLSDNIYNSIINISGLNVEHIFTMKPIVERNKNYAHNIELINCIYPVFLSNTKYHAYYYYSRSHDNSIFPYTIVTDNYAVSISYNFENAIISDNSDILNLKRELFIKKKNLSYALIESIDNPLSYTKLYTDFNANYKKSDTDFVTIEYEPCLTPYFNDEILDLCLNKNLENYTEILNRAKSIFSFWHNKNIEHNISYFTLDGVNNFVNTGRINEIPKSIYKPIPIEHRLDMLRALCKTASENQSELRIIKTDKLHIPKNLRYSGTGSISDFFLLQSDKNEENSIFKLSECGFAKPFYDFAYSLIDSDLVYSKNETLQILNNYINEKSQQIKKRPAVKAN